MNIFKKFFQGKKYSFDISKPTMLLISSLKKNQNYYRDNEILRQCNGFRLAEDFNFDKYHWDIRKIIDKFYKLNFPEFIFLNYNHHFTHKIKNLEKTDIPVFAFVGDTYDFIMPDERSRQKKTFIQRLNPVAYITAFPNTNEMLYEGIGDQTIKIITSHWAVDEKIFRPQNRWRRYDIGCLGAHTAHKYPFRNKVRRFLLSQNNLKFFKKERVYDHDGVKFSKALNRLKSCFTDASIYKFTLMKYFEIPACGTLLFGEQTEELKTLGFRDGVNFVEVNEDNFHEKFDYYIRGMGRKDLKAITYNGRDLILKRHTWQIRVRELLTNIKEILKSNVRT